MMALFEPAAVLPGQYLEAGLPAFNERRLMCAVMAEAFRELAVVKTHHQALEWFESRSRGWMFSFENICAFLSLDPAQVRRAARRVRLMGRAKRDRGLGLEITAEVDSGG